MLSLCIRILSSLIIFPTVLILHFLPYVRGNTEIINFSASLAESPDMEFPGWIQLNSSNKEVSLSIIPLLESTEASVESGLWFTLNLDDPGWSQYQQFTLRASWPASHPCDIYLKISEPLHTVSQLQRNRPLHSTRVKYAHVYAVNIGVPRPSSAGEDMTWLRREPVPIILVLEPLRLGVIPESVVPVILVLLVAIALAFVFLPHVNCYFKPFLRSAEKDVPHIKRE